MPLKYTGSNQRITEYHSWTCLCLGAGIESYLEIGCGSAHTFNTPGSCFIDILTVDVLPNGLSGIEHLQANSQDPDTVTKALEYFEGKPDAIFIDADHSYEGVKRDFELWHPQAAVLVGFHDILMPGVKEFWEEISLQYPSIQIIGRDIASAEAWQHQGHVRGQVNCGGIGVLFK